jgi:hypothetical protein
MGFWQSLGDGLSDVGHFVGGSVHEGLNDIDNIAKSAAGYLNDAKDQAFNTAGHLISGVEGLGEDIIQTGGDIIKKGESIKSLPLLILAAGVSLFLLSPNAGKAIEVGGQLGGQALKNPAVMGI